MVDTSAPNPFDLAAWRCNVIPIDNTDAIAWWMCALLTHVHGESAVEHLAGKLARVAPMASA